MKRIGNIILGLIVLYLTICCSFYVFQEKFLFQSTVLPGDYSFDFNFDFDERNYTMSDGAIINCLFMPSERPSKGVILYFHGNADNLVRWGKIAQTFTRYEYDVLICDFRGYGKSTGKRSMDNLFSDALALYTLLQEDYNEENIIIYGRSIGSGLACWLASQTNPHMLILETPFYSINDIRPFSYLLLPAELLSSYPFPNYKYLTAVSSPIRIFHGTDDAVVPYHSGKKLYESVRFEKDVQFISIEGGEHKNLSEFEKFGAEMRIVLGSN